MNLLQISELMADKNKYAKKFTAINKTLIFIEPYGSTLSLLRRGSEKGFNIVILSANADLCGVPSSILQLATIAIQIDTANDQALLELTLKLAELTPIHAIIPGFEYFVPAAVKLSHALELPTITIQDIEKFRRKDKMRAALTHAGVGLPKYAIIHSLADLKQASKEIGFPAVCKPIDAAGSVNVRKVNNEDEAIVATTRILEGEDKLWGYSLAKTVLYEEYISGREFSVEGVVVNGDILHCSMTEKFVADQTEFIEIGHVANAPIDVVLKRKSENYINKVLIALGANHCPFHAEIRFNAQGEPLLMEVAARLAGDRIADLISLARGFNYLDYVYAAYLNESVPAAPMQNSFAGIRFFYRPTIDRYSSISGLDNLAGFSSEELQIYYPAFTSIPHFPKPLRRLGHVILKNDQYTHLINDLDEIDQSIHFHP